MTPSSVPSSGSAQYARLLARGRALRTVAQYRPGAASQTASPFEVGIASARLDAFLTKHGLTHTDLDQDPRNLARWSGDEDWRTPKPREPHIVHRMDGFSPSGPRWRAWCRCGHGTTPRTTRDRALNALRNDPTHPLEPTVCCLCGKDYAPAGWRAARDRLWVLTDSYSGDEFLCCRDECGLDRGPGPSSGSRAEKTPPLSADAGRRQAVAEFVPMLVRERFPADLSAAVVNDASTVPTLLAACQEIDGGDAAMISVLFRALADQFAGQPGEADEILHSATPAAALAAKVWAQYTNVRTHLHGPGSP